MTVMIIILLNKADRYSLIRGIQLFTYEVIYQDKSIFIEDEPNRVLDDLIYQLEVCLSIYSMIFKYYLSN